MGLPFSHSLHQLYDRVATPLSGLFHLSDSDAGHDHDLLWVCFESGQMSEADLEREIAADPKFAAFVDARMHGRH